MSSGGSAVHRHLTLCKAYMSARGVSFEEALGEVPECLRGEVRTRWEAEHIQTIGPVTVLEGGEQVGPTGGLGSVERLLLASATLLPSA